MSMRLCALILLAAASSAEAQPTRHALVFGLDGCRPDSLLEANTPRMDALRESGAFQMAAMTGDVPISGPGWSSFYTGVWRAKHGVDDNDFAGARFDAFPSIYCRLDSARPGSSTANIFRWPPLNDWLDACADSSIVGASDQAGAEEAARILREESPDVLFVHLNAPDNAGHASGFGSAAYLAAIESCDARIGLVLDALAERPGIAGEEWLVVVTTDHGGSGNDHHDDIPENRTIFVILAGPGVAPGEVAQPVGIVDLAPTILAYLGIEIDPAWDLDGKVIGLGPPPPPPPDLALPGDANLDGAFDLADPVLTLAFLFEDARGWPCGGDGPTALDTTLLDANGDGELDLSDPIRGLLHLFAGGPPHALGAECAPFPGCPGRCR